MPIKDKLLFQVELIPPNTGSVKKVSQVLDQATASQRDFNKAQQRGANQSTETEKKLEKYDQQLRSLREGMRRAEEGARFYGASTDEATKSLNEQVEEARRVRAQLDSLEAQVDDSSVSMKKFQRIQSRATSTVKSGNLSVSRLENGFTSMSNTASRANQTMMDFGRILQDIPFGILGVSNNLDPATQSFTRLKEETGSTTGALRKMLGSLTGSGGVIFLLGSVVPTVATLATQGIIGFGSASEEASEKTVEFSDNLKTLIDNVAELRQVQGDDPLGIQEAEARLSSIKNMNEELESIREKQERIADLSQTSKFYEVRGVDIYADEVDTLEKQVQKQLDRLGLSEEQVEKLQEQEGSLEDQITQLEKMGEIDPVQAFQLQNLREANRLIENAEFGIQESKAPYDISSGNRQLRDARNQLRGVLEQTRQWLNTNSRDNELWDEKMSKLRVGEEILGRYNDNITMAFNGAGEFLDRYEQGIIPATVRANEHGFFQTTKALKENKSQAEQVAESLKQWVRTHSQDNVAWERKNKRLDKALSLIQSYDDTLDEIEPPTIEPQAPEDEIIPSGLKDQKLEVDLEVSDEPLTLDELTGDIMPESELEKIKEKRTKFQQELGERTFEIRQKLAGDLVSLQISTQRQLNDVEERANELGLQNTKEVEKMKTAIRRREAEKRRRIELDREKRLQEGRMQVVSQSASFIQAVNSSLAEESKALAVTQLAVSKGLEIAKVVMKTNQKVSELQHQASLAQAKAMQASADATFAFAEGNIATGLAKSASANQYQASAGASSALAGKVASQGALTVGLIGATTLAKAGGILAGGGDSSSSGGSSGGGGGSVTGMSEGFTPDENKDRRNFDRQANSRVASDTPLAKDGDVYIALSGDISDESIAVRAERGKDKIKQNSVMVVSDN